MFVLYGLLAATFVLLIVYLGRGKKRLPPGPRGLPIIGNLLSIDPKTPHESLAKIAWEYGPVCGLHMGSVYTVLLSDPKLVRQLFAKDTFSGRAPLYLTHGIMKGYGEYFMGPLLLSLFFFLIWVAPLPVTAMVLRTVKIIGLHFSPVLQLLLSSNTPKKIKSQDICILK